MLAVVIDTDGNIATQELQEPLYLSIKPIVDGHLEHVLPRGLPRPYCMLVNDEGLLRDDLGLNVLGTVLYGGEIRGNILVMKDGYRGGEIDIVGLEQSEAAALQDVFARTLFDLKKAVKDVLERR